nr:zinc finger SWIM domain-containing protein 8-like [Leptinotarsa decemlineata]
MLDWGDREGDRFSFEDSDRFEEDSLCSWSSEPESLCNNWRGWKKPSAASTTFFGASRKSADDTQAVPSLTELAAKCVASHIPFELVEHVYPPVPEQLQLRIAFWSFPDNEEDIRLYSCLANGSADEFSRGDGLHRNHMVKDPLQIGFHLSASVQQPPRGVHNVAVTFDRRRISSCNCTCNSTAYWCSHVVAVCLTRIHWPHLVTLRAPVSESLSRLQRDQLQKFAQYLISELPQQILPTAQRLLDELLGSQPSAINSVCGAPDPTAGASANDQTSWYLDEKTLHDNIKKILIKFCVPAPIVFSDVNYLSTVAPPAAAEWTSLLRPLRGREPEGMWNLLSIVREMFKRNDRNAIPLLEIITEECLACEQILIWWFNTKVALLSGNSGYGGSGGGKHNNVNSNTHASQHACSSLCDEVVVLWRLAALNPGLAPSERDMLHNQFTTWHMKILEKVSKCRNTTSSSTSNYNKNSSSLKMDLEVFTGFKPAIEACYLDWDDYPMPGITYTQDINPMYHCPFTCFRHGADSSRGESQVTQVNSSKAVLNCENPHMTHSHHRRHHHHHHHSHTRVTRLDFGNVIDLNPVEYPPHPQINNRDGNRSSVSSEGFCEVDDDLIQESRFNDSDSQEGGGSDSSSNSSQDSNTPSTTQHSLNSSDNDTSKENYKPLQSIPIPSTSNTWTPNTPPPQVSTSRRPSKGESTSSSNSESPQSGDEYNMYFYNSKDINLVSASTQGDVNVKLDDSEDKSTMFSSLRKCDDPWDVLFSRAEGLHAHGHNREACILGVKLAEELLMNPPDLMIEIPPIPKKKACCSRPHSSTSAEIEQGINNLSVTGQAGAVAVQGPVTRAKDGRYKGKRAYPSIPNQPSEAGAHFMFELAKTVLNKAGGTSSTSLFTQPSTNQNHHGPHRALHMCAFQLGLYALGLHNCVSPNWLSRTYSSHVSWITGQAMEIGAAAISFLIDTWEGHLTPPEAASIADRASRGCDLNMVRAAAELALSCLPHAHALNPNEIQRAILQCKEQSEEMLEHACHTVENAAKGGGVYPEVLFQVAKYWYELYIRHTPGGEQLMDSEMAHDTIMDPHGANANNNNLMVIDIHFQHAAPPVGMYVGHYNYVHHPHPHQPQISYGGPLHPLHQAPPPGHVQMYQFPYPPPPPQGTAPPFQPVPTSYANLPPPQQAAYTNAPSQYPQPPPAVFTTPQQAPPPQAQLQYYSPAVTIAQPVQGLRPPTHIYQAPPPGMVPHPPTAVARTHRPHQFNQAQLRYLLTSYRVGMLALETLARRVHDDRPQAKYARNPPYGEDVKWLLRISKHLGKKLQMNPATHQLSCLASGTLSKCAFLCSVLAENCEHFHLAFRVGMFGLEMARPPASTKPLEVKLANQEADLVNLLKRIPLGHNELQILRKRADALKDGTLRSRGEAMLPIMLASFIFDALVIPSVVGRDRGKIINMRLPSDEYLGFEAAVAALGLKANVSEADHPLLCEGTRRQRGDLAIALLMFYKDNCWKMARIMDRLLDKEVHQLLKTPIVSSYYSSNPPIKSQYTNLKREDCDKVITPISPFLPPVEIIPSEMVCEADICCREQNLLKLWYLYHFDNLSNSRSKSCKKELWSQINAALQANTK